jgi:NADH-quinone oxidoreductase subunit L
MVSDGINFEIGFLVDRLTVLMMGVVTFVSLMVHIYTIGYMADDEHNWPKESLAGRNSYQRFFAYISLFTFSMLMLVMSNNFLQLFFGWEAVGLVSYLLIGFWSVRESAIYANLKAFLVNRVGDFGFLLGIAAVLMYTNSLDYAEVFAAAPGLVGETIGVIPGYDWSVLTLICILLFVGAMGKSAQAPLHVWLPDSMEGPTPISALIHAATMVTAGIFMVARMSPLFEFSETALSVVMVIGAITAFFMGLLGVVQNDIKRVVAYSTLSQLGYMTVALGASAYSAAIFHLMTHAFFKALLFLAAGSVIIAMHHEQDIRKMGGLKKYMPITYWTSLIGSLALIGFPGFSGFFSKDGIIEAVHHSTLPGSGLAYAAGRGHRATGAAGDPVGDHRHDDGRPGAVRRLLRRGDLRASRARRARPDRRRLPRRVRVHAARPDAAAVLAGDGRPGDRLVRLHEEAADRRGCRGALPAPARTATQQVRVRRFQRGGVRRRWAQPRQAPVAER